MRTSSFIVVLLSLCAAAPAVAQPTVRSAVRDVTLPRVDSANSNAQQKAREMAAQQGQQPPQTQPQPQAQPATGQSAEQQQPPASAPESPLPPTPTVLRPGDPILMFEREVFSYAGRSRRDPFRPLTGAEGPLFEDLKINVILTSPNPAESIVVLTDGANKQYRVKRGDTVGNCCTVVDIGHTRVVFSVIDFGIRRQEVLALKSPTERS